MAPSCSRPDLGRCARRAERVARVSWALTLGAAAILAAAPPATAQTSTAWTQVQGGPAHTGAVSSGPEPPLREAWRAEQPTSGPGGQFGLSAPIVVGDLIVAVGPRSVIAVEAADGSPAWTVERTFGPSVSPAAASVGDRTLVLYTEGFGTGPGPADGTSSATPSVTPQATPSASPSSGTSPSEDGGSPPSSLVAIDIETQRPAWDEPVALEAVSRTGVTIDGETAFVADRSGTVYAVDVGTGELLWSQGAGGTVIAPLAAADGTLVVPVQGTRTTRARLVALDAGTGERIWRHEVTGAAVLGSAVSIDAGSLYAGFSDQTVRSFDLADGSERWARRVNGLVFVGIPVVTADAVVVVDVAGQVYRLDPATGAPTWDFALNELVVRSSALVIGDHVLVATARGDLAAIGLGDGRLVWGRGERGPVLRSLTPVGDLLIGVSGGPRAGLVAFEHDPGGELVSIASPTEPDPASLVLGYLAAAVPLAAGLMLGGRWLARRMGPAFLEEEPDPSEADPGQGDPVGGGEAS